MKRSIVGFVQDEAKDWVALLDCGHRQHVRHNPPLVSRPWVLSEDSRNQHLGEALNCVCCERFELPAHFEAYRKTPLFMEHSVPAGLQKDHTTRRGVWAKIHVLEGRLRYVIDTWKIDMIVTPESPGIVVPEVPHYVRAEGTVRFYVEFHADPAQERSA